MTACGSRTSLVLKNSYHSTLRKFRRVNGKETPEAAEMFHFFAKELPSRKRDGTCHSKAKWRQEHTNLKTNHVNLAPPLPQKLRKPDYPTSLSPSLPYLNENDVSVSLCGSNSEQETFSPMHSADPTLPSLYDEASDDVQRTENSFQFFQIEESSFATGEREGSAVAASSAENTTLIPDSANAGTIPAGGVLREAHIQYTSSCDDGWYTCTEGPTRDLFETGSSESFSSFLSTEDCFENSAVELCTGLTASE
eukprot:gb/GECG01012595.1/.p1 GENE.gb/GECG01012595.1/~~gb/GECG01012595.1/.p1  ORF type:complete len:252 (+),score=28.70 gb/GECG01012595.1/:1-756(+)